MNRIEIIDRFRQENPEFTANVISDTVLKSWLFTGDKETCAKARLTVDSDSFSATTNESRYDPNALLPKFFDVDEYPGGGISYVTTAGVEKRLIKTTKAELDSIRQSWRTQSSEKPKYYFRRGKYIHFFPAPDSTIDSFNIDFVKISEDFDNDSETPFDQQSNLVPFHYSLVLYLKMRAKAKAGKPEDAKSAMDEYNTYLAWIIKEIGGGKYGTIQFKPPAMRMRFR